MDIEIFSSSDAPLVFICAYLTAFLGMFLGVVLIHLFNRVRRAAKKAKLENNKYGFIKAKSNKNTNDRHLRFRKSEKTPYSGNPKNKGDWHFH